jgi:hypothetical protein
MMFSEQPFLLYFVTPILGLIRNYAKYRDFDALYFVRTPILYFIIRNSLLPSKYRQLVTIIFERWVLFIYKTLLSIFNNDYHKKKYKYIKKYNMKYDDNMENYDIDAIIQKTV